ncbi:MAG: peptidoglycan DD-metalloendopeptidase family protein [Aureliella sp.]
MKSQSRKLRLETLEARQMLAADLAMVEAYLVDSTGQPVSEIHHGQQAMVRVDYLVTDLTPSDRYRISFALDGLEVLSDEIPGRAGVDLPFYRFQPAGYSKVGTSLITVRLDADAQIAESDEGNNEFSFQIETTSPELETKFMFPVPGEESKDWTLLNHHDVDIRSGTREDFVGGFLQYDNHSAWDIGVNDFEAMDDGYPIIAAAAGTVTRAADGFFDREDFWDFTFPDPRLANFVQIDHGDGWTSWYYHFKRDSLTVKVGDRVAAGQTLGLMGSSGISNYPHVDFSIRHDGVVVEPMYAVEEYFEEPPEYLGYRDAAVLDVGITNSNPEETFREGPNDVREFGFQGDVNPWVWFRLEYARKGQVFRTDWIAPEGTIDYSDDWTVPDDFRYFRFWSWTGVAVNKVGRWTVKTYLDGEEVVSEQFDVRLGGGANELEVRYGDDYIIDRRSTPIDLGKVAHQTDMDYAEFQILNRGGRSLHIRDLQVPAGFEAHVQLPVIQPGQSTMLRVKLDSNRIGKQRGEIVLDTTDQDEGLFRFDIEGEVTNSPVSNAPEIVTREVARAIEPGIAHARVFQDVEFIQDGATDFRNGHLDLEIVSGKEDGDGFYFDFEDPDFEIRGKSVLRRGRSIALLETVEGQAWQTVRFAFSATKDDVSAVLSAVSLWQRSTEISSRQRVVKAQAVDVEGRRSLPVHRSVFYAKGEFEHPPSLDLPSWYVFDEDEQLAAKRLEVTDFDGDLSSLQFTVTSNDPWLVKDADLNTYFDEGNWWLQMASVENANGTGTLTITVADEDGLSDFRRVGISVNSVNDRPSISGFETQSVEINQTIGPLGFSVSDVEDAIDDLFVEATSSNETLIPSDGIAISNDLQNPELTITPASDEFGTSEITVIVTDLEGGQTSTTFTVKVGEDTVPPDIGEINDIAFDEDHWFTVPFTVSDDKTDLSELAIRLIFDDETLFPPEAQTVAGDGALRELKLTPAVDQFGSTPITIEIEDRGGNVARETFVATVDPVNDFPSFEATDAVGAIEDAVPQSFAITDISHGGGESGELDLRVSGDLPDGFQILSVNYPPGSPSATVTWQFAADLYGNNPITVTLEDGGLDGLIATKDDNSTVEKVVNVTVEPVNDAPTDFSLPASVSVRENASGVTIGSAIVADVDDDSHRFEFSEPGFEIVDGELRVRADAMLDYETNDRLELTIIASDSGGEQIEGKTTVFVKDVNEAATEISLSEDSVYQELFGQVVGALSAEDPDEGQAHEFESLDSRFEVSDGNLMLADGFAFDAGQESTTVRIRVTDDGNPAVSSDLAVEVYASAMASPWQNPNFESDTNSDGFVTPLDALLVINYLNSGNPAELDPAVYQPIYGGVLLDVSGDRFVTPLDALMVINELNQAEGERAEDPSRLFGIAGYDWFYWDSWDRDRRQRG